MKYFTRELWRGINSSDINEKESAYIQWEENTLNYETYIKSLKSIKIKKFLKKAKLYDDFHDYDINSVIYNIERNTCDILLSYCGKRTQLHLWGICSIHADMQSLDLTFPKLRWGYYEIELLSNKRLLFSVIFDMENEIEITANGVRMREVM